MVYQQLSQLGENTQTKQLKWSILLGLYVKSTTSYGEESNMARF